jgi:hypothetical protein
MIKLGEYHLDTLREVSDRLTNLANSLPDNRISFAVEFSTRPYGIMATAYEWRGLRPSSDIKTIDRAEWFFERDPEEAEQKRLELLDKVSEWEEKYGI